MRTGPAPRRIILASASPRRKDLLEGAGFEVVCRPADVEELSGGLTPRALVAANAELKAVKVAEEMRGDLVLGADTIVVIDGEILGKPRDLDHAAAMLERLGGRVHEVLTGVCMLRGGSKARCTFVESTRVAFRPLDSARITDYFLQVDPLDKAGAYAAQQDDGRLIEHVEGCLDNVIGLPVSRVVEAIGIHFSEKAAG